MLYVGQTYSTSNKAKNYAAKISNDDLEILDSAQNNYYYQTHLSNSPKNYNNQRGITQYGDQECIIISSTNHIRSESYNPWEDEFNEDIGYIYYYGDNKTADKDPATTTGNKRLLEQFRLSHSNDPKERAKAIPILFFESKKQGERTFHGYGTVESIKLVTQYSGSNQNKVYFSNYLFTFCVFSLKKEQEGFDWSWIDARREKDKFAPSLAPKEWQEWIKDGNFNKVRRHVYGRNTANKKEQLPTPNSKLDLILDKIYSHYKNNPFGFEYLAKDVTRLLIEDSGTICHDGWVTKASGDGGYDYVLRIDIGNQGLSQVRQVVLGQAKCYEKNNGVSGKDVDRIIARLKRGWLAAFVTTSYFTNATQQEILEDNYPILLITGKQVAEIVNKEIYRRNISLDEYLKSLNMEQEYKNPEDILKEE
ncbi:MAG: restriction endonuclease [Candidatus Limosilactobacillus intestinavium]